MARVTFVQPDGSRRTLEIACGTSVMAGAVAAGVRGIVAVCGGQCQCATCHCYVDPHWVDRLPPADGAERNLIDFAWEPRANSRLTCRLEVGPELDGLTLHVPAEQYA